MNRSRSRVIFTAMVVATLVILSTGAVFAARRARLQPGITTTTIPSTLFYTADGVLHTAGSTVNIGAMPILFVP